MILWEAEKTNSELENMPEAFPELRLENTNLENEHGTEQDIGTEGGSISCMYVCGLTKGDQSGGRGSKVTKDNGWKASKVLKQFMHYFMNYNRP
jgi:hypothetical protein